MLNQIRVFLIHIFFLLPMLSYGQKKLYPAFHTTHMLSTKVKITQPAKDSISLDKSLIKILSQEIIFFEPENIYPFIKLSNKVADKNLPTIINVPLNLYSISPFDSMAGITKFIQGKIVNPGSDTLTITTHIGGTLIAIQEAKNVKGFWRPIEYWFNDRCGNSFKQIQLAPNEYIDFFIPRYYGSFKTKIRLRILIGTNVFLSEEWDGKIDKGQFVKPAEMQDKNLKPFYSFLK